MEFFAPARKFYAANGFAECKPFAASVEDPQSVFMTMAILAPSAARTGNLESFLGNKKSTRLRERSRAEYFLLCTPRDLNPKPID